MLVASNTPRVWALADLHWSTKQSMTRYGYVWDNHRARIIKNWRQRVSPHDLVLVPGDLTFSYNAPQDDLAELHRLPGQKVFVPGNHDRWTQGVSQAKLVALLEPFPTIHMLNYAKPYYETGEVLIVGYKGSEPPENPRFNKRHFNKTVEHARSLVEKVQFVRASFHKVIVTTHYPPSGVERDILAPLEADLWLHGHAHIGGDDQELVQKWERARTDPPQKCISADYLDMVPLEVTGGVIHPHI